MRTVNDIRDDLKAAIEALAPTRVEQARILKYSPKQIIEWITKMPPKAIVSLDRAGVITINRIPKLPSETD
jgi:hypothetical protein